MYMHSTNILGQPQVPVQITQADWKKFLGQDSAAPNVPLPVPGQTLKATDPIFGEAEFVLAYGVSGLRVGDVVRLSGNYATTRVVAGTRGRIAVSMSANTSPSALSWFCTRGQVPLRVATAVVVDAPLFLTAVAGVLDDAGVAGDNVVGAYAASLISATLSTKQVSTENGSDLIRVPDLDGLYVGMVVVGTGIPAATTIAAIGQGGLMLGSQGPQNLVVQLSAAATATGSVSANFNHAAAFCTGMIADPSCPGAV